MDSSFWHTTRAIAGQMVPLNHVTSNPQVFTEVMSPRARGAHHPNK
jgi:hypothetical protein